MPLVRVLDTAPLRGLGVIVVDEENFRALPAHIEMYRAALALSSGDLAGTITHKATNVFT